MTPWLFFGYLALAIGLVVAAYCLRMAFENWRRIR